MDPGTVVWLPGSGYDGQYENWACEGTYGDFYFACGDEPYNEGSIAGTLVYCCW
jgi:hypothetical protein